jgi:hypothetical protein
LRTTKGVAIPPRPVKASFHQELIEQDCMACHSDHQGPKLTKRSRKPFSHALLKVAVKATVLVMPRRTRRTRVHRDLKAECSQCHGDKAWKPAHFEHELLAQAVLAACESCHNAPTDRLHRQITGSCKSCHTTEAWKPATFDHDKYFVLDRDHEAPCETCHKNNDYSRYTCYGCHEHSEAKVRAGTPRRRHPGLPELRGVPSRPACRTAEGARPGPRRAPA